MNATLNAARLGLSRGRIEFLATFRSPQELLFGYLFFPALFVGMALLIGNEVEDELGVGMGTVQMIGGMVMILAMAAIASVAQVLITEREDGTLLRSRSVPRGMIAYTVGKIVHIWLITVVSLALMVIPALLFLDGFAFQGVFGVITFLWILLFGLLALAPIGAIAGSLLNNPKSSVGIMILPILLLVMTSGIFFPLEVLPTWIQTVAYVFPLYWIGAGVRAAIIPAESLESGLFGAANLPVAAGVLALWALIGFLVAQRVLRTMARRQSGSRVQAAREEALKRAY